MITKNTNISMFLLSSEDGNLIIIKKQVSNLYYILFRK